MLLIQDNGAHPASGRRLQWNNLGFALGLPFLEHLWLSGSRELLDSSRVAGMLGVFVWKLPARGRLFFLKN